MLVSAAASGGSNAGCPSRASSGSSASTSTQAGAHSGSQGSFSQGLEDALRSHLASWAMRLVQLQPKASRRRRRSESRSLPASGTKTSRRACPSFVRG